MDIAKAERRDMAKEPIKVFNCELGRVRVIIERGEPLFCLADIAYSLGIRNGLNLKSAINDEFDKGGKFSLYPLQTKKGKENYSFINESEMYFVIMQSDSKKAEPFRQWVAKEVLPSVRKMLSDKKLPQAKNTPSTLEKKVVANATESNVQIFNCNLGQVRVITENGEPLFCLADLAHSLDFRDGNNLKAQIIAEYDNEPLYIFNMDRVVGTKKDGSPAIQNAPYSFVTESQLYFVLMRSRSAKAKPFRQWLTKEVLPSIRKTGGYSVAPQIQAPTNFIEALELALAQAKEIEAQKQVITYQGGKLNDYKAVEKVRRSKMEMVKAINKNVKLLAEQKFNKQYASAYSYIYSIFAGHHNITSHITMEYLKKNNDYLEEVLRIVLAEIE